MSNHPNRAEPTPEQRLERENRRAAALQIAGQVRQGSQAAPKELTDYAEKLVTWIKSGKLP